MADNNSNNSQNKIVRLAQLGFFKQILDIILDDKVNADDVEGKLVTAEEKAAWDAKGSYSKPSGGIPASDLAQAVQDLLTAAGTALQPADLNTLNGKVETLEAYFSTQADSDAIINKWVEIVAFLNGISETDTLSGLLSGITTQLNAKYVKPSGGIPASDLAFSIPSSLGDLGASVSTQAITSATTSACSITGSENAGKMQTIIYTNATANDITVTVPTTYSTPDGQAIEITCPAGGYCEVSYVNVGGTVFARGL